MPRLSSTALNDTLHVLPQLRKLSVSADYISPCLFDEGRLETSPALDELARLPDLHHTNLRTLELTYSGASSGVEDKITAIDVIIAIDAGALPGLRQVRVDQALLWQSNGMREDVEALSDVLQDRAKRDWEDRAWLFESMSSRQYHAEEAWKKVSGVWIF